MFLAHLSLWVVLLGLTGPRSSSEGQQVCLPNVFPASPGEDVKIAVVLSLHEAKDGRQCGTKVHAAALQNAFALYWVANLLKGNNSNYNLIPGINIGIEIYDDCSIQDLASLHASSLAASGPENLQCLANVYNTSEATLAGVLGSSFSRTTTALAGSLRRAMVPVVGFAATLPELGDKTMYPNFVRVVPSDLRQAQAIIQIAKQLSWSYIVGISTSDNYGSQGMAELMKLAKENFVCVVQVPNFDKLTDLEMKTFARENLSKLMEEMNGSLGILYFGENEHLINFLNLIEKIRSSWNKAEVDLLKKYYWLASDAVIASGNLTRIFREYGTNILVVSPFLLPLESFKTFFRQLLESPPSWVSPQWKSVIGSFVRTNLGCSSYNFTKESLTPCQIDSLLTFDPYLPSVLDAFYLLTNSLRTLHNRTCPGVTGACVNFIASLRDGSMMELLDLNYSSFQSDKIPTEFSNRQLKKVSGDFDVTNQPLYSIQAVSNDKFITVAEFQQTGLVLRQPLTNLTLSSQCKQVCERCLPLRTESHLLGEGDPTLVGIFSIQDPLPDNAYTCQGYRSKSPSYIAMKAFIRAIKHFNNETGARLGYLVIDDCYSPLILTRFFNEIMSGDIQLDNGRELFNKKSVVVAIGAKSSDVTLASLPILTALNIPLISYSATHSSLDNRVMYPYFSRTVASDTVQARALVEVLKKIKVTYVASIIIQNNYGRELYRQFRSIAEAEGICVRDADEVTESTTPLEYGQYLENYRIHLQVIVVIAVEKVIANLLAAAKQEDTFIFIGSESWGTNMNIINPSLGRKARGALVLSSVSVQLDIGLKDTLLGLDPFQPGSSVWLQEFWQDLFQCDLPGGFRNTYGAVRCEQVTLSLLRTMVDDLMNAPNVANTVVATLSAAQTISSFVQNKRPRPFDPKEFVSYLRSSQLDTANGKVRPFLDSGNGGFGFDVYNVQPSAEYKDKFTYVKVGTYTNSTGLSLDEKLITFYDASGRSVPSVDSSLTSCKYLSSCKLVCSRPVTPTNATPGAVDLVPESDRYSGSTVVTLAVLLALFGLLALVLLVLTISAYTRKHGCFKLVYSGGRLYSTVSSRLALNQARKNSYSNPEDSSLDESGSIFSPQLPARRRTGPNVAPASDSHSIVTSSSIAAVPSVSQHLSMVHPEDINQYGDTYINAAIAERFVRNSRREPIVFQNVSPEQALYARQVVPDIRNTFLDASVSGESAQGAQYLTPHGLLARLGNTGHNQLVLVPALTEARARPTFAADQIQPSLADGITNERDSSTAVGAVGSPGVPGSSGTFGRTTSYITPIDVEYNCLNSPIFSPDRANDNLSRGRNPEIPMALVSSNSPKPTPIVILNGRTCLIDSRNYLTCQRLNIPTDTGPGVLPGSASCSTLQTSPSGPTIGRTSQIHSSNAVFTDSTDAAPFRFVQPSGVISQEQDTRTASVATVVGHPLHLSDQADRFPEATLPVLSDHRPNEGPAAQGCMDKSSVPTDDVVSWKKVESHAPQDDIATWKKDELHAPSDDVARRKKDDSRNMPNFLSLVFEEQEEIV